LPADRFFFAGFPFKEFSPGPQKWWMKCNEIKNSFCPREKISLRFSAISEGTKGKRSHPELGIKFLPERLFMAVALLCPLSYVFFSPAVSPVELELAPAAQPLL